MLLVRSTCFALVFSGITLPIEKAVGQMPFGSGPLPFRPLGSASLVDRYDAQRFQGADPTRGNGQIRKVVAMQSGFALPSDIPSGNPPVNSTPPPQLQAPPTVTVPNATPLQPRNLPTTPSVQPNLPVRPGPMVPASPPLSSAPVVRGIDPRQLDYQPVVPPQLGNGGFATMADCNLITPPSGYTALSSYGCSNVVPTSYANTYVPPPAQIAGPATMPPLSNELLPTVTVPATVSVSTTAAPAGSLMTFGQETYPVQVGQGLWGQPVAYVPGQRFRNWLRYLSF